MAATNPRRDKLLTEEEKKKIAKNMEEGYKKMADLNLELAEDGIRYDDETT